MHEKSLRKWAPALSLLVFIVMGSAKALAQDSSVEYLVNPGDVLAVSVWREEDLQLETIVRPDGKLSFPLVGEVVASDRSVDSIRQEIVDRIAAYIPEAVVTVMVRQIEGNKAYVVGKVNRPGPIVMTSNINVMQALSIAGGTAQFAGLKDIVILRGQGSNQTAIPFDYDEVEDGENLEQNTILQAGDVVVVP